MSKAWAIMQIGMAAGLMLTNMLHMVEDEVFFGTWLIVSSIYLTRES